jgi:hypothetical protein
MSFMHAAEETVEEEFVLIGDRQSGDPSFLFRQPSDRFPDLTYSNMGMYRSFCAPRSNDL